jgi:hypothetical protein
MLEFGFIKAKLLCWIAVQRVQHDYQIASDGFIIDS